MKELEGIKLEKKQIKKESEFLLLFWSGDELSQQISFKDENECNKILNDIVGGKGVDVEYGFHEGIVKVFPRRVIKIKCEESFSLSQKDLDKLVKDGKFTKEIDFPNESIYVANNCYRADLSRIKNDS